jgi:hypothetical protein
LGDSSSQVNSTGTDNMETIEISETAAFEPHSQEHTALVTELFASQAFATPAHKDGTEEEVIIGEVIEDGVSKSHNALDHLTASLLCRICHKLAQNPVQFCNCTT